MHFPENQGLIGNLPSVDESIINYKDILENKKYLNLDVITRIKNSITTALDDKKEIENKFNLGQLTTKLDLDAQQIKEKTSGILGFFRYLFWPGEKAKQQQLAEQMDVLRAFIVNVVGTQPRKEGPAHRLLADVLQSKAPLSPPNEKLSEEILSDESSLPKVRALPQVPPTLGGKPSSTLGRTPPPRLAPPMMMKKPVEQLLPGEPKAPEIKLPGTVGAVKVENLAKDALMAEIREIEGYVVSLGKVNAQLSKTFEESEALQQKIKEERANLKEINDQIAQKKQLIEVLQQPGDTVTLMLKVKDDKEIPIVYFSEDRFGQVSQRLKEEGLPPLDRKFLKSEELAFIEKQLRNLIQQQEASERLLEEDTGKLELIKEDKKNGVAFDQLPKVLKQKTDLKSKWERALKARQTQLEKLGKQKTQTEGEGLNETKIARPPSPKKRTIADAIETNADLIHQFPELESLGELYHDQNAQILLRGELFHNKLIRG